MSKSVFDYEISKDGIKKLILDYFPIHDIVEIDAVTKLSYEKILKDVDYISSLDPSQNNSALVLSNHTKSLVATMCYRVSNTIYYMYPQLQQNCRNFSERVASETGVDIHPQARIDDYFFIDHGVGVVIGATAEIGKYCNIFNDVILGSKNVKSNVDAKRHPTLKDNVTICAGSRVLGNITIGKNCFLSPHVVVLDDVPDDTHVSIVNQLQLSKRVNRLPSQKMVIYGVVPKFKNTLKILGDGFYNPTVLVKVKDKNLNYNITYWDKQKILLKFKNTTPLKLSDLTGAKIVILSNSDKVIITNSYGLTKCLTSLC